MPIEPPVGEMTTFRYLGADGNTLPVFDVFHKYTRPIHRTDGQ